MVVRTRNLPVSRGDEALRALSGPEATAVTHPRMVDGLVFHNPTGLGSIEYCRIKRETVIALSGKCYIRRINTGVLEQWEITDKGKSHLRRKNASD